MYLNNLSYFYCLVSGLRANVGAKLVKCGEGGVKKVVKKT
jgi:hypothetical protein